MTLNAEPRRPPRHQWTVYRRTYNDCLCAVVVSTRHWPKSTNLGGLLRGAQFGPNVPLLAAETSYQEAVRSKITLIQQMI